MLLAEWTILAEFKFIRGRPLVFGCCIIAPFALTACKGNNHSHLLAPLVLLDNFTDHAGTDGTSAFTDGKAQLLLHGDRGDQFG